MQSSKNACEVKITHNADVQDSRQLKIFQPYYKKKISFYLSIRNVNLLLKT